MTFAMVIGLGALGFIGPDYVVNSKIKSRQERIRAQLPDALDLLAVSVEAGLGFDSAVTKLIDSLEGPLIDEFNLTLSEIRVGESRPEALRKLAERAGVSELSAFTRALIQADTLGISLGRILRVQAADARERRQLDGRGARDEGADQDALPDGALHLPVDVHRHDRPRVPLAHGPLQRPLAAGETAVSHTSALAGPQRVPRGPSCAGPGLRLPPADRLA